MSKCLRASMVLAAAGLMLAPVVSDAAELSRGQMLSISCAGCHGTDGKSPGSIPSIAGKSADTIETTLKEFRSGKRESTVMDRHAKGYTDEELKLIAQYFASIK